jgi:hypothetical protein
MASRRIRERMNMSTTTTEEEEEYDYTQQVIAYLDDMQQDYDWEGEIKQIRERADIRRIITPGAQNKKKNDNTSTIILPGVPNCTTIRECDLMNDEQQA